MASQTEAWLDSNQQIAASADGTQQTASSAFVTTTIVFTRLEHAIVESIHTFLRKHDTYVLDLAFFASHVVGVSITIKAVRLVTLKYSVHNNYVASLLPFDFIAGVLWYDELESTDLRQYLEKQAAAFKTNITIDSLNYFVMKDLRTSTRNDNAVSRMHSQTLSKKIYCNYLNSIDNSFIFSFFLNKLFFSEKRFYCYQNF